MLRTDISRVRDRCHLRHTLITALAALFVQPWLATVRTSQADTAGGGTGAAGDSDGFEFHALKTPVFGAER